MSRRMGVAVMAVAVLVFIAACGSNATPMPTPASPAATHTPPTATPTVSEPDSVQATLLRYQDRWERSGITDYDYTGAWSCFCPQEYLAEVAVTVRGGVVTSVEFAGEEFTVMRRRCRSDSFPSKSCSRSCRTPLGETPRASKCPTTNATATPQNCSSTTTRAWRTRRRDSSFAGLRFGSHDTRVTYAHASPWHAERPVPGRYSATRDSEQAAAPATFSPAMWCSSQQTCESRDERASPAGSRFRRGRSGRACRARVSPAPSWQRRRPRPQMLP